MSSFKERQCTRSVRISVLQWVYLSDTSAKHSWFNV